MVGDRNKDCEQTRDSPYVFYEKLHAISNAEHFCFARRHFNNVTLASLRPDIFFQAKRRYIKRSKSDLSEERVWYLLITDHVSAAPAVQ
jgi:hypothetical protein